MKKLCIIILNLFFVSLLSASEFTIKKTVTVEETGSSLSGDPVEAFENAVDNAKRTAARMIESKIKAGTVTEDGRLSTDWVEKKANIQVFNVKILEKTFISEHEVKIKIKMTAGYLNYAKFWIEYDKTVQGATHRSAFMPGWGQIYNREFFSAGLYGVLYCFFYGYYFFSIRSAKTEEEKNKAFTTYQIPAIVFWTLSISDAGISRIMAKFGLEQIKKSYQVFSPKLNTDTLCLDIPFWQRSF